MGKYAPLVQKMEKVWHFATLAVALECGSLLPLYPPQLAAGVSDGRNAGRGAAEQRRKPSGAGSGSKLPHSKNGSVALRSSISDSVGRALCKAIRVHGLPEPTSGPRGRGVAGLRFRALGGT